MAHNIEERGRNRNTDFLILCSFHPHFISSLFSFPFFVPLLIHIPHLSFFLLIPHSSSFIPPPPPLPTQPSFPLLFSLHIYLIFWNMAENNNSGFVMKRWLKFLAFCTLIFFRSDTLTVLLSTSFSCFRARNQRANKRMALTITKALLRIIRALKLFPLAICLLQSSPQVARVGTGLQRTRREVGYGAGPRSDLIQLEMSESTVRSQAAVKRKGGRTLRAQLQISASTSVSTISLLNITKRMGPLQPYVELDLLRLP